MTIFGQTKFGKMSEDDKQFLADSLYEFSIDFEKQLNMKTFLCGGTFLAAVRDKDFISHDSDVDLYYIINETDRNKVRKVCIDVREYYRKLGRLKRNYGSQLHVLYANKITHVDLFASWVDKTEFYCTGTSCRVYHGLKTDDILPLKSIEFKGLNFNIPNNPERYAEWSWGSNWITPNKNAFRRPVGCKAITKLFN